MKTLLFTSCLHSWSTFPGLCQVFRGCWFGLPALPQCLPLSRLCCSVSYPSFSSLPCSGLSGCPIPRCTCFTPTKALCVPGLEAGACSELPTISRCMSTPCCFPKPSSLAYLGPLAANTPWLTFNRSSCIRRSEAL